MQGGATFSENNFREQAKKDGITHISTGVALLRDNRILMVRRAADDFLGGVYELPGGGVDEGEKIIEGAVREVKEETGLTVSKIVRMFEGFDYTTNRKPSVRQINFLVEVAPGEVVLDPAEHDDFIWVDENNTSNVNMSDNMRKCVSDALRLVNSNQ